MGLILTRRPTEAVVIQMADVSYRLVVLDCGPCRARFSAVNTGTGQQVIRALQPHGPKWNVFADVWLSVADVRGRQVRLKLDAPREVVILREELQAFAPDIRELRQYLRS